MFRRLSTCTAIILMLLSLQVPSPAKAAAEVWDYPVIPVITGPVAVRARQLVQHGKTKGNRLNIFSKVGDSITANPLFLSPVGTGGLRIGGYGSLLTTVQFFTRTYARTHNSFANVSLAARGQWTSREIINPGVTLDPGTCQGGETPLDCELRVNRPAVALIMIGTNDVTSVPIDEFRANLNRIIDITESYGVVPVLSTIINRLDPPDALARCGAFNAVIVQVAAARNAPLWNYWLAVSQLPNAGVSTDNVHPSQPDDLNTAIFDKEHLVYGMNMRNLTALQVLESLRRTVLR